MSGGPFVLGISAPVPATGEKKRASVERGDAPFSYTATLGSDLWKH